MEEHLSLFLKELTAGLGMKIFMGPVVGNDENIMTKECGPSAFVGWTTSGCQVHSWPVRHFVSIDIYSCKKYNVEVVLNIIKKYFDPTELVIF
jgi:S-adenosylmethionine decarboxylase